VSEYGGEREGGREGRDGEVEERWRRREDRRGRGDREVEEIER
jgi:hypothetical protein